MDDSAILDCHFSDFYHTAPQGFEKILFEQQIFWAGLSWGHHPPSYRLTASLWRYRLTVIGLWLDAFFFFLRWFVSSQLLWVEARLSAGSIISDHQCPCKDTLAASFFVYRPQPAGVPAIRVEIMHFEILIHVYVQIWTPLKHMLTSPLFMSIYWNHPSWRFFWVCLCDPAECTFVNYWSVRFQSKHICHHLCVFFPFAVVSRGTVVLQSMASISFAFFSEMLPIQRLAFP